MPSVVPSRLTRDPNVVPMIDVLLVLLIIFMIAQQPVRKAFDLQLPVETPTSSPAPSIVLSVEQGSRYVLNGTPIARGELGAELQRVFADRPTKVLFMRGAPTARYHEVVAAFDAARGAGVRVTGIVPARH